MPRHGCIEAATIATADLAAAERAWVGRLGYVPRGRGTVSEDQALCWGTPRQAGRPYVLLGPASGVEVFVRLIESEIPAGAAPRRAFGWAALELTVQDADALYAQLRESELAILGEPTLLEFTDRLYPMQAVGPTAEVLYLNEVRGDLPDVDLPLASSFVDHLFIVVLGAPDLEAALDFYRRQLGFESGARFEIPIKMINDAFGLPSDRRHRLATARVGRHISVEIDQLPAAAAPRLAAPGMLPPAIAMVSLSVKSLADVGAPRVGPTMVLEEAPYRGRRAATCRGAAGELIEVIEVG